MDIKLKLTTTKIHERFPDIDKFYKFLDSAIRISNNSDNIEEIGRKLKINISQLELDPVLICGTSSLSLWVCFKDNGEDLLLIYYKPSEMSYPLDLRNVFVFGPFEGKTVEYALNKDCDYITECLRDIEGFSLTERAKFMLIEKQAEKGSYHCRY